MDIWVLNHRMEFDKAARRRMLEKGQLTAFSNAAEILAEIWFAGAAMDENSLLLQSYVLNGGTFGTLKNHVQMQRTKQGNKLQFILRRIFQPYEVLKLQFPVLQKHKWLFPFFQVRRWCNLIFCGGIRRSAKVLETNRRIDGDKASAAARHLGELGL